MSSQKTYFNSDDSNKIEGDIHFNKIQFVKNVIDKGSSLSIMWPIYEEEVSKGMVDEDTQILESLSNLENGNYTDYKIKEYLKEIDR